MEQLLDKYYELANTLLSEFGATDVSIGASKGKYGSTYTVHYWKESLDKPGETYIFLSAMGESFDEAIEGCRVKFEAKQNLRA